MTILVTGAGGFVGLNVVERLLGDGHEVVALGNRALPPLVLEEFAALPGRLHAVVADVRDADAMAGALRTHAVRRIFHGAAITLGPAGTIAPAEQVVDVNLVSTQILVEAALAAGVERFVYPSSSTVYGAAAYGAAPITEATPVGPTGLYGMTKLASERLVLHATRRHGLPSVRGRITAVFGPWEHDTGLRETLSVPYQVARQALAGAPVVLAPGGWRDWTSARDVARAFAVLLTADTLPHDVYNITMGEIWNPALLCEALAPLLPSVAWSTGAATTIAYNDDVTLTRMPLVSTRFAGDFGFRFMPPGEAVADYARWIAGFGEAGFAALRG